MWAETAAEVSGDIVNAAIRRKLLGLWVTGNRCLFGEMQGLRIRQCGKHIGFALSGDGGAGDLKDNPTSNLDGMVGEAFIKPPQESDIDGRRNAVRPVLLHEEGE